MGRVKMRNWQPHKRITEHGIDTLRVGESVTIPVADRAEVVKIQAQVGEFNRWKGDSRSRIITKHAGKWLPGFQSVFEGSEQCSLQSGSV